MLSRAVYKPRFQRFAVTEDGDDGNGVHGMWNLTVAECSVRLRGEELIKWFGEVGLSLSSFSSPLDRRGRRRERVSR